MCADHAGPDGLSSRPAATSQMHPFFDDLFWRQVVRALRCPEVAPFQARRAPPAAMEAYRDWMHHHRHSHPFYEIMVGVRGDFFCGSGNDVYQCGPGSVVVIPPNQTHVNRYRPGEDGLRHLWVSFVTPEQAFLQAVDVRQGRARWIHAGRSLMPVGALSRILRELENPPDIDPASAAILWRQLRINAFYAELLRVLLDMAQNPSDSIDHAAQVSRKVDMISRHIASAGRYDATLAELAQLTGYTPSHFARLFKRETGVTVHQHINACRIAKARELMAAGMPGKAMATVLGFADKTTLSRWLNQHRRAIED